MRDLQNLVVGLNLQGERNVIADIADNVLVQLIGEELNIASFPAVVILMEDESGDEDPMTTTFLTDGVTYPVKVVIRDQMATNYQQRRRYYQLWRETIATAIRGLCVPPIFADAPECWDIRVKFMKMPGQSDAKKTFIETGVIAFCHTNLPRTKT